VYPVVPRDKNGASTGTFTPAASAEPIVEYELGTPEIVKLNQEDYQKIVNQEIQWNTTTSGEIPGASSAIEKIGAGGVVILNHKSLTINEKFEGYYVGLADNFEFFPNSDYSSINNVKAINKSGGYRSVPKARLNFALDVANETTNPEDFTYDSVTQTYKTDAGLIPYQEGSISEVFENLPESDISTEEFADILVLGVFKLRKSTLDPDTEKLDYVLSEYHIGSLNANREKFDPTGGAPVSYALQDVSSSSANLQVMVNPHIANSGDWVDRDGAQIKSKIKMTVSDGAKALFAHGVYKEVSSLSNQVGEIPTKLDRIFELIDNHELFPLDITLEAGLGTIFAATNAGTSEENYDDEAFFNLQSSEANGGPTWDPIAGPATAWDYNYNNTDDPTGNDLYRTGQKQFLGGPVIWYRNVANRFVEFAANKRKDHMCILDPLRHIFIQGVNSTVLSDKSKNFSQHVYWPLRHIYQSINTSYGAVYGNWAKVFDGQLGRNIWVPMSGYLASTYANTDANFQPWYAPAGFTRGVINGIADIAIYPKQKHRDQLYKINVNPVANFPNDGFVVFGQKTLQSKPSAFDRVNVRRLFLYLEKATRATAKYFVFEPNTLFTRTQVGNILAPIFDRAKNTEGLYDYLLICDERNNTPDVIDQNEMVIDIYIKPVRAAEFILVNFYATRTGQDFSELVS